MLWPWNMDFWLLGKIYWFVDWNIFYHLVHEKVHQRLLNSVKEKKIKVIPQVAKTNAINRD